MEYIPLSVRIGGCAWYYTIFLNPYVIGSIIRMVSHSIASDLVRELWRDIRKKDSKKESDLVVKLNLDDIHLQYPFKIKFTNDECFETDLDEKLAKIETEIVNDLSRLSLRNHKFREQNS